MSYNFDVNFRNNGVIQINPGLLISDQTTKKTNVSQLADKITKLLSDSTAPKEIVIHFVDQTTNNSLFDVTYAQSTLASLEDDFASKILDAFNAAEKTTSVAAPQFTPKEVDAILEELSSFGKEGCEALTVKTDKHGVYYPSTGPISDKKAECEDMFEIVFSNTLKQNEELIRKSPNASIIIDKISRVLNVESIINLSNAIFEDTVILCRDGEMIRNLNGAVMHEHYPLSFFSGRTSGWEPLTTTMDGKELALVESFKDFPKHVVELVFKDHSAIALPNGLDSYPLDNVDYNTLFLLYLFSEVFLMESLKTSCQESLVRRLEVPNSLVASSLVASHDALIAFYDNMDYSNNSFDTLKDLLVYYWIENRRDAKEYHALQKYSLELIRNAANNGDRGAQLILIFNKQLLSNPPLLDTTLVQNLLELVNTSHSNDSPAIFQYAKSLNRYLGQATFSLNQAGESTDELPPDDSSTMYNRSAELGYARAQYEMYQINIISDPRKALEWLKSAAEQGLSAAQFELGKDFQKENKLEEAIIWFSKAVAQNHFIAQNCLGNIYRDKDQVGKAERFYYSAAIGGHVPSMAQYGMCLEKSDPTSKEACNWYYMSIIYGDVHAYFLLGTLLQNIRDQRSPTSSIKFNDRGPLDFFRDGANLNDADCLVILGDNLCRGSGVNQLDALVHFYRAANAGSALGQLRVAECYRDGNGTLPDPEEAVAWFKRSAEQNNVQAQRELGLCLIFGNGIEKDAPNGLVMLRKAAAVGDDKAKLELANCIERGLDPQIVSETMRYENVMRIYRTIFKIYPKVRDKLGEYARQVKDVELLYEIGNCFLVMDNPELNAKGKSYLEDAANLGNKEASYALYQKSLGDEAIKWLKKAAELQHPKAQYEYAFHLLNKNKNRKEAAGWYQASAFNDYNLAQLAYAEFLRKGDLFEKNLKEAVKWYLKAGEKHSKTWEALQEILCDRDLLKKHFEKEPNLILEMGKYDKVQLAIYLKEGFILPKDVVKAQGLLIKKI